jgi:hypothetical protein
MKHSSKDWPNFGGQILNYISWKHEWKILYEENYLDQVWEYLDRALVRQTPSCMT